MARLDPKFLLDEPNGNSPTEVRLRLNYEYKRFIYPLYDAVTLKVYKILPCLWDKEAQCPVANIPRKWKEYTATCTAIKSMISKVRQAVFETLEYARVNEVQITNDFLREQLDIKIGKRKKVVLEESNLNMFYQKVIDEMIAGSLLTGSKIKYDNGTIKSHKRTLLLLQEFDLIKNHRTIFNDIDNIWYDSFVNFLTYEYEDVENNFFKEDYAPATIGKHIKNLKMIMALAVSRKISTNREYEQKYFTKPKKESFAIYLTVDEIKQIYNLKLEGEYAPLDKYRDMFLIGCYTALRVSDYTNIRPENFKRTAKNNTPIIEVVTKKTSTRVQIPIANEELYAIAEKYHYNFPKISTQKLNEAIKKIGEMAGITQLVTYERTKGGITESITVPKCQLICSHTGRRSAATNMYNIYEVPERNIMLITGHKTSENFRRYIKISTEENADKVNEKIRARENGTDNNH